MRSRRTSFSIWMTGQIGRMAGLPLLLVLCAMPVGRAVRAEQPAEFRGLWVVRHDLATRREAIRVVNEARLLGFNALLVQVRGRGGALYKSDLVPRSEVLEREDSDYDPLATVISHARQAGLQVHAWVNVFLSWHPDSRRPASLEHILLRHPDWFMVSSDGIDMGRPDLDNVDLVGRGVEGRYLSPGIPEVRAHLAAVVGELVREYDLDGLHLDYARYPNRHYDYNLISRAAFVSRYKFDPAHPSTGLGPEDSTASTRAGLWTAWRAKQVTETIRSLYRALHAEKPWVRLSVAVKPDPAVAYQQHGQDWVQWVNAGLVDFVVPMFYIGTTHQISGQIARARQSVVRGHVYAGLGFYNQSARASLAQIERVRRLGVPGLAVYSYAHLRKEPELARRLQEGPFALEARVPRMPWKPERGEP